MNVQADRLTQAIVDQVGDRANVHRNPAGFVTSPAVVIAPAADWESPDGHGQVLQRWDVHIYTAGSQPDRGWGQLWELSQLVANAARTVGSVWTGTDHQPNPDDTDHVAAVVHVQHRYRQETTTP